MSTLHMHDGCWFCSTPICETCPDVAQPHTAELRDAYVAVCPDCAGPLDAPMVEPPFPADPLDLDESRPADLDACSVCGGTGGVPVGDFNEWLQQVEYDACPACEGTGRHAGGAAA